jgi:hypothetical protein
VRAQARGARRAAQCEIESAVAALLIFSCAAPCRRKEGRRGSLGEDPCTGAATFVFFFFFREAAADYGLVTRDRGLGDLA